MKAFESSRDMLKAESKYWDPRRELSGHLSNVVNDDLNCNRSPRIDNISPDGKVVTSSLSVRYLTPASPSSKSARVLIQPRSISRTNGGGRRNGVHQNHKNIRSSVHQVSNFPNKEPCHRVITRQGLLRSSLPCHHPFQNERGPASRTSSSVWDSQLNYHHFLSWSSGWTSTAPHPTLGSAQPVCLFGWPRLYP